MYCRNSRTVFVILAASWLVSIPLACLVGPFHIPFDQILHILWRLLENNPANMENPAFTVVSRLRLARACVALLCGGVLAGAGAILQGALRNPLADPFTMGISSGAACGASMAIVFMDKIASLANVTQTAAITFSALAGALSALAAALVLGRGKGVFGKESIILAGIAVSAFLGALVALVKALNEDSVTSIVFWIMGSLQGRGWESMPLLLTTTIPGLMISVWGWRKMDLLSLGDEQAAQLGISPASVRLWLLCGASCMTAGCVAVCGVIGFVGLVIPHIIRLLLGPAHGPLLLCAFFGGGLFLLGADTLARTVLDGGQELPAGVVTALAGGPFFAFLIWKK